MTESKTESKHHSFAFWIMMMLTLFAPWALE